MWASSPRARSWCARCPAASAARPSTPRAGAVGDDTSCVVVQYPDVLGRIADLAPLAEAAHAKGALLVVVVTEPVALGAIRSPGEMGADIVVGEGQSIGVGLQFGGPYLGLFATREKFVRQMPGRLCGETVDAEGKRGFVLTLSTREQHIRREKATSNICTNSGLCALAERGVLAGVSLGRLYPDGDGRENGLVVAVTETVTSEDVEAYAAALEEVLS